MSWNPKVSCPPNQSPFELRPISWDVVYMHSLPLNNKENKHNIVGGSLIRVYMSIKCSRSYSWPWNGLVTYTFSMVIMCMSHPSNYNWSHTILHERGVYWHLIHHPSNYNWGHTILHERCVYWHLTYDNVHGPSIQSKLRPLNLYHLSFAIWVLH